MSPCGARVPHLSCLVTIKTKLAPSRRSSLSRTGRRAWPEGRRGIAPRTFVRTPACPRITRHGAVGQSDEFFRALRNAP